MYVRVTGDTATYTTLTDMRRDFPNVSFPATITDEDAAQFSVYPCAQVPAPAPDPTKNIEMGPPALEDGAWVQTWLVTDASAGQVAERLAERKAAMRQQVNDTRNTLEEGTAPTPFGAVDSDARSSKRLLALQGAAQTALITGTEWTPLEWTMADNSRVTIDTAATALILATAVTQYAAALHAHASALKDQIDAAEDHGDLDAVDIGAGWP